MLSSVALRVPLLDALSAIVLAAFAMAAVWVTVEITDPEGAFGLMPELVTRDAGDEAAAAACACAPVVSIDAPVTMGFTDRPPRAAAASEQSLALRARFLGETASLRERSRTGASRDLRVDLQAATLTIRSLGATRADTLPLAVRGGPR